MKENLKSAMWIAVATCVGVLLAKVIINTGVIDKFAPGRYESDDEPVLF